MKILGISCFYHDAAAALIVDGKIVAAAEEERFSRKKHDSGFPHLAIEFCLKQGGIKSKDLDYVVFYEKPFKKFERIILSLFATAPYSYNLFYESLMTWLKEKLWLKDKLIKTLKIRPEKILFSEHHLSHAGSSFFTSPYKESAILTTDGVGEWSTTVWGLGKDNKLSLDYEINFPHSLGLFYSTFTQFLGFEINEGEYKVMGLAPFGKPKYTNKVRKLISQAKDGSFKLNLEYFSFHKSTKISYSKKFIELFGVSPNKNPNEVSQIYSDIAASAQNILDETLVNIATYIQKTTRQKNLCLAGGVALNGVSNWAIYKKSGFKNIYIHPAAGDSGGAVGAALYVYYHVLGNKRINSFSSVFLGDQNSKADIKQFLTKNNIPHEILSEEKLTNLVSNSLARGKVIGWVQGRFEWGPRALGARSILADPRDRKMKDIVNSKIKFREGFRPFAPVALYEEAEKYFEVGEEGKDLAPLLYMLFVVPVKKDKRKFLGAITHVDGTARPQFIKKEHNPLYYKVVNKFYKKTGVPVLLNTSFNLKGEPIVNTIEEAYATFIKSGIDLLVVENFVIEKNDFAN